MESQAWQVQVFLKLGHQSRAHFSFVAFVQGRGCFSWVFWTHNSTNSRSMGRQLSSGAERAESTGELINGADILALVGQKPWEIQTDLRDIGMLYFVFR